MMKMKMMKFMKKKVKIH